MNDSERRDAGKLFDFMGMKDDSWIKARASLDQINNCPDPRRVNEYCRNLFGSMGEHCRIVAPFHCDVGKQIFLGNHIHINMDCLFLDSAPIIIEDHVHIGARVMILSPMHPLDPDIRATGLESCKPVTIKKGAWICSGAIINPGITIGEGSVIGSGSVVTHDIEDHVIAVGNPCRVLRKLDESQREKDRQALEDYMNDPDTADHPEWEHLL